MKKLFKKSVKANRLNRNFFMYVSLLYDYFISLLN